MPYKPKKIKRPWVTESKPFINNKHSEIYNSTRWRKFRKLYLQKNPLCVKCKQKNIIKEAEVLDHIKRIADGGAVFDEENLQPLCKIHHQKKSGKERHGYRE